MPNYNLVVPDTGKEELVNDLLTTTLSGAKYHLFTNSPTIDRTLVIGGLTEASWTGYLSQTLSGWSAVALDGSHNAYTTAAAVTVLNTDSVAHTANGYYITDAGGALVGAAYFPTPQSVPAGLGLQDTFTFTLNLQYATSP